MECYIDEGYSCLTFIEEMLIQTPGAKIASNVLYDRYRKWHKATRSNGNSDVSD